MHNILVITYENDTLSNGTPIYDAWEAFRNRKDYKELLGTVQALLVGPTYGTQGVNTVVLLPSGGEPDYDVHNAWKQLALMIKQFISEQEPRHVLEVVYGYDDNAEVVEDHSTPFPE